MAKDTQSASAQPEPADEAGRASPDVAALTRRMTEGDEMAWRNFYNSYFGRLWRYLLVVAAGREDAAQEALQGTLIRAARHIKVFRDEPAFWSWLTVLARSALADERKKRRRYFAFLDRFTREAEAARDSQTEERLGELLDQRVAALPPDERELIEQKYFARRPVRDLADDLQTTEKAVESKLSRVRKKLKDTVLAELKAKQNEI